MPTAGKLFAALAFALVGLAAALAFQPLMPQGTRFGWFVPVCTLLGAICGWRVMGPRAGLGGAAAAMGVGLSTSVVLSVTAVFVFATREMVIRSMNRRFDGVMDAALGTFDIALDYGLMLLTPQMLAVLVGGGAIGGLVAHGAARHWR